MFFRYKKPKKNIVDDCINSIRDANYLAGMKVGTDTAIDY